MLQIYPFGKLFFLLYTLYWLQMALGKSAISCKIIRERKFWIMRDDLLLTPSGLSGNKARKFKHLEEGYLPKSIVSFGGHQSNALCALAKLVHYKNCEIGRDCQLTYVCKVLPRWLKANPTGNFKEALNRGTKFVELETEDFNILTQLESEQALTQSTFEFSIYSSRRCMSFRSPWVLLADEIVANIEELRAKERAN